MRPGKWGANTQLQNSCNTLMAIIDTRKAFFSRVSSLNPNVITKTHFDSKQREIHARGRHTPQRMQRLAHDALIKYAHATVL